MIQIWCPQRGPADDYTADQSAVGLRYLDKAQTCLSLAAVVALKGVEYATFEAKKVFRGASLLSSAKPSNSLPFSLSTPRSCASYTLMSASTPPSPLLFVLEFVSGKTTIYFRASADITVLLRAVIYVAFCPSGAS